jgi:hypothetical protein
MLACAIIARELEPFRFTATAQHFSLIPFSASMFAERQNAMLILLRKAFEYGGMVWLLRAAGVRYLIAGAATAAALVLLELAQRYLPNRQPEITDAAIALIMACVLWGVRTARGARE